MIRFIKRLLLDSKYFFLVDDVSILEIKMVDECKKYKKCDNCPSYLGGNDCKYRNSITKYKEKLKKIKEDYNALHKK